MLLEGKIALVTGGASGIGRATCRSMAEEGAKVIVADIDEDGARRTASDIGDAGFPLTLNVAEEASWQAGCKHILEALGRLDIVANVAGIGRGGSIEDTALDDWHAMIAVNLTGTMLGCKHGLKAIVSSGGAGAIINVSSIAGLVGTSDLAGYCASKGGVTTLTKSVALHCAEKRYQVRCISIHPTYVDTEMLDPVAQAGGISRSDLTEGMAKLVPMGRVATPKDIADTVVFAASDRAAMISGSALMVDGAQLAGPPSAHF
ncbi:MAG: SDR family oxidoreductase [Pseudomonadota bacterium]